MRRKVPDRDAPCCDICGYKNDPNDEPKFMCDFEDDICGYCWEKIEFLKKELALSPRAYSGLFRQILKEMEY